MYNLHFLGAGVLLPQALVHDVSRQLQPVGLEPVPTLPHEVHLFS